jgi:uncharacterized membrane-anchored protein YhcB (DUF1043 family)
MWFWLCVVSAFAVGIIAGMLIICLYNTEDDDAWRG